MDVSMAIGSAHTRSGPGAYGAAQRGLVMQALLFIVIAAVVLGAAQFLGWTSDSRDARDWHTRTDDAVPDREYTHAA